MEVVIHASALLCPNSWETEDVLSGTTIPKMRQLWEKITCDCDYCCIPSFSSKCVLYVIMGQVLFGAFRNV